MHSSRVQWLVVKWCTLVAAGRAAHVHFLNVSPTRFTNSTVFNCKIQTDHEHHDSITHDARLMQYGLELQGADKVVMGSDYPFPLGDLEFGRYIEEEMDLSEADRAAIFHGAALEWLGIEKERFA